MDMMIELEVATPHSMAEKPKKGTKK